MSADTLDTPTAEDWKIWRSDISADNASCERVRNDIMRALDNVELAISKAISDGWLEVH